MSPSRSAHAALIVLMLLQAVMLSALFAGIAPHPPATTPIFGIAPFIAAAIAVAAAALTIGPETRSGRTLSALAAVLALVSFGPQKYLDPQFALIWPAVVTGQVAALVLVVAAARGRAV